MTSPEHEPLERDEPFWHLDDALGELELRERASGPSAYTVRLKARTMSSPYRGQNELYPLQHDGTEHEISGKACILVPDITLTVGLFNHPVPSGAIGTVRGSTWEGMRHHEIANVRGLSYDADQAIGLWEVETWGRLDEFTHGRLWQLCEAFMLQRFASARRVYTDDWEPRENKEQNREFLQALGYAPVPGTLGIMAKEVAGRSVWQSRHRSQACRQPAVHERAGERHLTGVTSQRLKYQVAPSPSSSI